MQHPMEQYDQGYITLVRKQGVYDGKDAFFSKNVNAGVSLP